MTPKNMIHHYTFTRLALGITLTTLAASSAHALDLHAGDYDPAPAGTTITELYLQNSLSSGLYLSGNSVPGRNRLHKEIGIVSLQHYVDIGGTLAVPIVLLPFGRVSETVAGSWVGSDQGLGNPIIGMPFWLINDAQQQTYLAIGPYAYLPLGSYDRQRAVNLSDNRYRGILQVAFSTRLTPKIAWDIAADTTVYGDNRDAVGGGRLSQKPGFELQTSGRYFLSPWTDLRAGIAYTDAGATKQNGISADATTESKFWLGTSHWFSRKTEVIAIYGRDIAVKNGFKDRNQINIKVVQLF